MSLEEQAGLDLVEPCSEERDLDFILFLGPWAPIGKVLNKWGRGEDNVIGVWYALPRSCGLVTKTSAQPAVRSQRYKPRALSFLRTQRSRPLKGLTAESWSALTESIP